MTRVYKWLRTRKKREIYTAVLLFIFFTVYIFLYRPPVNFPVGRVVSVDPGQSLQSITTNLYDAHVIRSQVIFRTTVILLGGEKRVIAGDYMLSGRIGPVYLAYRLVRGKFQIELKKVTVPEGFTVFQIADEIKRVFPNFDKNQFLNLAKSDEGYLFPETYFFSSSTKAQTIIDTMKKTFQDKVLSVPGVKTTGRSLRDVIIMASILEDEARTTESRKVIAGILWNRLAINMPLQVDSTFIYINGKNTYELTREDLKIKSPYNTYVYRGLPPGPIGNPGLDSVLAALAPTASKYLYFLSERDGTMHYAVTYAEHLKNKAKYVK